LFNRKSIDGTSVEDIAAELGTTTGAVYHYFKTKGALVFACYDRAYDIYNQQAEVAASVGETGLQRLLYTIRFAIESAELAPLVVFTGAEQLPSKGRRRIVNRLRELVERAVTFYREGEVDGSLRSLPALSTVLALGGSVQRASQWHSWGSLQDQRSAADQILTLFASGLRRRPA
jgi:AcrR family transcriptional regulator